MGETANQTRDEIVRLRQEMSEKIAGLRKASERPLRIARMAAVGTVAVIVVGGVTLIVLRARRRAEARSFRSRARAVAHAVGEPQQTARQVRKEIEKATDEARQKMRAELKKELREEVKDARPLPQKILTGAVSAAVSAGIPIVMRKLQEKIDPTPVAPSKH